MQSVYQGCDFINEVSRFTCFAEACFVNKLNKGCLIANRHWVLILQIVGIYKLCKCYRLFSGYWYWIFYVVPLFYVFIHHATQLYDLIWILVKFTNQFLIFFAYTAVLRGALGQPVDRRRTTSVSLGASEASAGVPPYCFVVPSLCHMPATVSVASPRLVLTNLGKPDTQHTVLIVRLMHFTVDICESGMSNLYWK